MDLMKEALVAAIVIVAVVGVLLGAKAAIIAGLVLAAVASLLVAMLCGPDPEGRGGAYVLCGLVLCIIFVVCAITAAVKL